MNETDLIISFAKEHVIGASGLGALLMAQIFGIGIGVKGLDGRYRLANQAMQDLFDKKVEQITSMGDIDLFPSEVAAQL